MKRNSGLEKAFDPKAVAIVGVSSSEKKFHPGYTGLRFLRMLQSSGFGGRIYPINPRAGEIDGIRVYPSLSLVPEPLDLVIITVPASSVPVVLEDCAKMGALDVHICTSGFDETREAEGVNLEERLREVALRGGLRVIGPNCMGYHVPSAGLRMYEDVPMLQGAVAFITQSGSYGTYLVRQCAAEGIGFSKVISYGNALIMDATDYLEYLATDPETQVICMYLEGVKDGRRLTELVRRTNLVKPVIIWKGGLTESGARAVNTHTGTLAGDKQIWDTFFKQTGAIRVYSLAEMADILMTLLRLRSALGRRVAVLGNSGGGTNVARGDICAEEGIEVPVLSHEIRKKLMEFVSLVNQSVINPMDVPGVFVDASQLERAVSLVSADHLIDFIILHISDDFFNIIGSKKDSTEQIFAFKKCILGFADDSWGGKPVVVAKQTLDRDGDVSNFTQHLRETGIIIYGSLRRSCRALSRFARYHEFLAENSGFESRV
ncbi:CoA-binding protein [Chloroflexota bacterium]